MLLYTPEADALRATRRDVFGFEHDAGDGWLIFALPPTSPPLSVAGRFRVRR